MNILNLCNVLFPITVLAASIGFGQNGAATFPRSITVADGITMTEPAGPQSWFDDPGNAVASFSPDGTSFLVLLKTGNLENNTNEFSLYAFEISNVFSAVHPRSILTMSSSSNRRAIEKIKWLGNEKIAFLGEDVGEVAQVYTFDLATRQLEQKTHHPTAVTGYDITQSDEVIVFTADAPGERSAATEETRRNGIVITNQELSDLVAGDCAKTWEQQLFIQKKGREAVVPIHDVILAGDPVHLSPNGHHALVGVHVRRIPNEWRTYKAVDVRKMLAASEPWEPQYTGFGRYVVVNVDHPVPERLLDGPMVGFSPARWAPDSQSVFLKSVHLPLNAAPLYEGETRGKLTYDVQVNVSDLAYRRVPQTDWPAPPNPTRELRIILDQSLNTPPRISAFNRATGQTGTLLDLNPAFDRLRFGPAKTITLHVRGLPLYAGLYLPPDYSPRKKYPLVIQTHGYVATEFSMDGLPEWSSGFAARALAAQGIVVLQTYAFANTRDHDRLVDGEDKRFGSPPESAVRKLAASAYDSAIAYLHNLGIIDDRRVGIVGFSRTVCFVAYSLTHSRYHFRAASLIDGIDCGYFQHLAFPMGNEDDNLLNGGKSPFSKEGLTQWMRESPGFNLYRVNTPVRLVAFQPFAVLEAWEWYSGLKLQRKPVDFVELPDASHLLVKPWERMAAQQGLVDWFRFWLLGQEDSDPGKKDQYTRWRALRRLEETGGKAH